MSDLIIEYGTMEWNMVRHVFLNGNLQPRVQKINFTQQSLVRPYTGPCLNENQTKVGPGYVFDYEADDFIVEEVHGDVTVEWTDKDVAKAWMQRHAQ